MKEKGIAVELLSDYKKANKRQFIVIIIILSMWFATIGYLVYILNDIEVVEDTIEIQDVRSIEDSDIQLGDK